MIQTIKKNEEKGCFDASSFNSAAEKRGGICRLGFFLLFHVFIHFSSAAGLVCCGRVFRSCSAWVYGVYLSMYIIRSLIVNLLWPIKKKAPTACFLREVAPPALNSGTFCQRGSSRSCVGRNDVQTRPALFLLYMRTGYCTHTYHTYGQAATIGFAGRPSYTHNIRTTHVHTCLQTYLSAVLPRIRVLGVYFHRQNVPGKFHLHPGRL